MKKTGRNDPCYCGSGKKYKKCCIKASSPATSSNVTNFSRLKLRKLEGSVVDQHLLPYVEQVLPENFMQDALDDLLPKTLPDAIDPELLVSHFFMPWFLFNWLALDPAVPTHFTPELSISENYYKAHNERLNSQERRFLQAMSSSYYSFYAVLAVEEGRSLQVKDLLLETTHTVQEQQGTYQLSRGFIIFGRLLTLDNESIFIGLAPFLLPADYASTLVEFKQWLIEEYEQQILTADLLRQEAEMDLIDYFFELIDHLHNRPPPELRNTDDEPIEFTTAYFNLTLTPEAALNTLLVMTLSNDANEFLADAERDNKNNIIKIKCPWLVKGNKTNPSWDNTVLGHIIITSDQLTLETNSAKRAARGKGLLEKYLGNAINYQRSVIETPEQKMKAQLESPEKFPTQSNNQLLASPELQAHFSSMAKTHWQRWLDESLPALKGESPRQAAKTDLGRERLEALLLTFESRDEKNNANAFKPDVPYLRAELGLD